MHQQFKDDRGTGRRGKSAGRVDLKVLQSIAKQRGLVDIESFNFHELLQLLSESEVKA